MIENTRVDAAGCEAWVEITPERRRDLAAIVATVAANDEGPDDDRESYALVANQPGRHFALGFGTNSEKEWFFRWDDGADPELVEVTMCESGFPTDDAEEEVCMLPLDHPGPHGGLTWCRR